MGRVKVSPKGQVVIPKQLREKFGIKEGEEVLIEESRKGVLVIKKNKNPLIGLVGLFEGKTSGSSSDLVRDIRRESEARIEKSKR